MKCFFRVRTFRQSRPSCESWWMLASRDYADRSSRSSPFSSASPRWDSASCRRDILDFPKFHDDNQSSGDDIPARRTPALSETNIRSCWQRTRGNYSRLETRGASGSDVTRGTSPLQSSGRHRQMRAWTPRWAANSESGNCAASSWTSFLRKESESDEFVKQKALELLANRKPAFPGNWIDTNSCRCERRWRIPLGISDSVHTLDMVERRKNQEGMTTKKFFFCVKTSENCLGEKFDARRPRAAREIETHKSYYALVDASQWRCSGSWNQSATRKNANPS